MTETSTNFAALLEAYENGASDVEVAKLLKITKKQFYTFVDENPDFASFVERGRTLQEAWWYEIGRKSLFEGKFNVSLYNFCMKNKFGWADKVETTDPMANKDLNMDELKGELRDALMRLEKRNPELLSAAVLQLKKST